MLNKRNATVRVPTMHLTIDETLYPYRGCIGLKTYNPSKPAKYGLLVISLSDAEVPYTYFSLPYAGKPEEPNQFYVPGTDEKTQYLVDNLSAHVNIAGRNISMDRYFTSVQLSEWLLDRKITVVGMMKENRVGMPPEIKRIENREERLTVFAYNSDNGKDKMLISYIDKKKSGKKNILALTTMYDTVRVSKDQRKKPDVLVFYDKTKGGVDVVDYVSSFISTRFKTRRWPMNAFAFALDTARTNARTVFDEVHQKRSSNFDFTWNLGEKLILPEVKIRYEMNLQNCSGEIVKKMASVLGVAIRTANTPKT